MQEEEEEEMEEEQTRPRAAGRVTQGTPQVTYPSTPTLAPHPNKWSTVEGSGTLLRLIGTERRPAASLQGTPALPHCQEATLDLRESTRGLLLTITQALPQLRVPSSGSNWSVKVKKSRFPTQPFYLRGYLLFRPMLVSRRVLS